METNVGNSVGGHVVVRQEEPLWPKADSVLLFEGEGVAAWLSSDAVHISLPDVVTEEERDGAIAALMTIRERTPAALGWVVDLSRLQKLPLFLVGSLYAHYEDFQAMGREVQLVDVPHWRGSPGLRAEMVKRFRLGK